MSTASDNHPKPPVSPTNLAKGARSPETRTRRVERRRVHPGEGLSLKLLGQGWVVEAEATDCTPEGMGGRLTTAMNTARALRPLPRVGEFVVVHHTGRATTGLRHCAVVTHVRPGDADRAAHVGFRFLNDRSKSQEERRKSSRFTCPPKFPSTASAVSPIFFREVVHLRAVDVGRESMAFVTSTRSATGLLPGLEVTFKVMLPPLDVFEVRGRVASMRLEGGGGEYRLGVVWVDPPRAFLEAILGVSPPR